MRNVIMNLKGISNEDEITIMLIYEYSLAELIIMSKRSTSLSAKTLTLRCTLDRSNKTF